MKNKTGKNIRALKAICFRYGIENTLRKTALLYKIAAELPHNTADVISLHNCLLGLMAFPDNRKIYQDCQKLMNELLILTASLPLSKKNKLANSGIAGTEVISSFSYPLTKWLVKKFPDDVNIHSSEADAETIRQFFRQILPRIEYERISAGELSLKKRIRLLNKGAANNDLLWLLNTLESSKLPERTIEFLFDKLKLFIEWKLTDSRFSKSGLAIFPGKLYCHGSLIRSLNFKRLLKKKIPAEQKIVFSEKEHLVHIAKTFLAYQCRETDPFTFASENEISFFHLERGISIALYGMNLQARLSIESYIGYLVFKNGVPVAYGGGWIFGERCQFGINIGEAFRGGESAYVFAQLLRVYHQFFNIKRFVITPYQFGKNNSEAINTGAFWFYYKFGFRPENGVLKKEAQAEAEKKKKNREYKTPAVLLRKFTGSNLYLNLSSRPLPVFDASEISDAISQFINTNFDGDREKALRKCFRWITLKLILKNRRRLTAEQNTFLAEWSLLAAACLSLENWTQAQKKKFTELLLLKGSPSERKFILALQKHKRFWRDISHK